MSTYIQLILEVTTGDDLAFDGQKRGDDLVVIVKPERAGAGQFLVGDHVKAKLINFGYIPEEAIE